MLCAQSCEVSSLAQRRALEQHQPMPSSCARDLWLLWEHLQGATSVYMVHTVTPNLSIKWSYQMKRAGREVAGKRWADLVQDHCCLKNENSWLQILSGHALSFPRHHISAVAVPASPLYISYKHWMQEKTPGEVGAAQTFQIAIIWEEGVLHRAAWFEFAGVLSNSTVLLQSTWYCRGSETPFIKALMLLDIPP